MTPGQSPCGCEPKQPALARGGCGCTDSTPAGGQQRPIQPGWLLVAAASRLTVRPISPPRLKLPSPISRPRPVPQRVNFPALPDWAAHFALNQAPLDARLPAPRLQQRQVVASGLGQPTQKPALGCLPADWGSMGWALFLNRTKGCEALSCANIFRALNDARRYLVGWGWRRAAITNVPTGTEGTLRQPGDTLAVERGPTLAGC